MAVEGGGQISVPAIGGAGIGIGVVALVQRLPPGYETLQAAVAYAAPAISVVASLMWRRLLRMLTNYQLRRQFRQAMEHYNELKSNPAIPQATKDQLDGIIGDLAIVVMKVHVDGAKDLISDVRSVAAAPVNPSAAATP